MRPKVSRLGILETMCHRKIVLILLFAVSLCACSSSVAYERRASNASPQASIDLNTATAGELEKLPHIGQSTAERIVKFREENGPFKSLEELLLIRGVSEERLNELRPFLRVD